MTTPRTLFIPRRPSDAYQEWKEYWHLLSGDGSEDQTIVADDRKNKSLTWEGKWGPARILATADFIPARGGCVLYLTVEGQGSLSRLLLSSPLEQRLWRSIECSELVATSDPSMQVA